MRQIEKQLQPEKKESCMTDIQNVLIWGAGAMGALYADKFYECNPDVLFLLADGERYQKLVKNGLTVNGKTFFPNVMRPAESRGPFDLIIVALKHHHLIENLMEVENAVGKRTILITVMNGIDSEQILGEAYGREKMLLTVAVGMDALRKKHGVVYSNEGRLIFGEMDRVGRSDKAWMVKRLFEKANIACEIQEDMIRPLWWKFMINVGVNQVSAVLRAPFGVFQRSENARALMEKTMLEVIAVANASGVDLSEKDIDEWGPVLEKLSPEGKTSMLQDIEAGRKTEVEIFAGKIMELGQKFEVQTPVNETLFQIIKVFEES